MGLSSLPCVSALMFLILPSVSWTANILFLSPLASPSHCNFYNPIIDGLAEKGHQVTVYSQIQRDKVHKNIRHVYVDAMEKIITSNRNETIFGKDPAEFRKNGTLKGVFKLFFEMAPMAQKSILDSEELQALRNSKGKQKFDLVMVSSFLNEAVVPFARHFEAPLVMVCAAGLLPWLGEAMGTPDIPSVHPLIFSPFADRMSLLERFINALSLVSMKLLTRFFYFPQVNQHIRDFFGPETPTAEELLTNTSLALLNTHFSIAYPKTLPPNVVEIAGIHCRSAKELPKDLKEFADNSGPNGFIYFSLGSVAQGSNLSPEVRQQFQNAFSKLPYKVLWKWETDVMEGAPENVRIEKWLPQQDILGHPNIRLFMTHGGLMSTEEAIYHGVPVVGIPLFGDQDLNMKRSEQAGIGKKLEIVGIDEKQILTAIKEVTGDKRYSRNVRKLSQILRDRQNSPVDTAVWWLEYVIRYRGAKHLELAATKLNLFQFYCLDVFILFLITIFLIVYIPLFLIRRLVARCCSRSARNQREKQKKA